MKIFGNRRRRSAPIQRPNPAPQNAREMREPQESAEEQNRLSPTARGALLLLAAIVLFVSTVLVCFSLIKKSAEPLTMDNGGKTSPLKYVVDSDPPPQVDAPRTLEAPKGVNDSQRLNILLLSVDPATESTGTLLLLNVDLRNAEVAMLSIPRDTFVSGNFEMPKIDRVYAESGERGVQALEEQVRAMFGFQPDYYFEINEQVLQAAIKAVGPISFEIPEEPAYSGLPAGTRELTAAEAMKLLQFDADYTTVGTEPARVQRSLLQTILDKLLAAQDKVEENAEALAAAARTDLTAEDLMYFGYLLKDTSFAASFSRALPGTEITIEDYAFYQVNPQEALELINASFNPSEEPLTVFDLNFRQKTGASTEGEIGAFGFGKKTESTEETDATEETTASSAPEESSEQTQESTDNQTTEAPTTEP